MNLRVLYEDNHLIAVYKPAGVLVQADATKDPTLIDEVKYYLKQKYNKPGRVFLGLVHRLDRPVAGIIIFAKTSKGAERLSAQIRARTFKKTYHALVCGRPSKDHGALLHFLKKDDKKNFVTAHKEMTRGALRAELDYEVVKTFRNKSIVKINLITGRPHQIRAQLAAIGCPIVGDVKYGGVAEIFLNDGQHEIALSATSLSFQLATKDERKTIEIPMPEIWQSNL